MNEHSVAENQKIKLPQELPKTLYDRVRQEFKNLNPVNEETKEIITSKGAVKPEYFDITPNSRLAGKIMDKAIIYIRSFPSSKDKFAESIDLMAVNIATELSTKPMRRYGTGAKDFSLKERLTYPKGIVHHAKVKETNIATPDYASNKYVIRMMIRNVITAACMQGLNR